MLVHLKERASRLKAETYALYLTARHPGTPWYAKLLVAGIVAYALSPSGKSASRIAGIVIVAIWIALAALAAAWAYSFLNPS